MDLNSINDPNSPFPRAIFKTFQGFSVVSKSVVSQVRTCNIIMNCIELNSIF